MSPSNSSHPTNPEAERFSVANRAQTVGVTLLPLQHPRPVVINAYAGATRITLQMRLSRALTLLEALQRAAEHLERTGAISAEELAKPRLTDAE